jgi:hypothetical protein
MRSVLIALLALLPATAAADRIYDKEKNVTHDCGKEPEVIVNVSNATFTFTGACKEITMSASSTRIKAESIQELTVTGSKNTIHSDALGEITVTGTDNAFTYKKALSGKKPGFTATGTNNKISAVK